MSGGLLALSGWAATTPRSARAPLPAGASDDRAHGEAPLLPPVRAGRSRAEARPHAVGAAHARAGRPAGCMSRREREHTQALLRSARVVRVQVKSTSSR